MVPCDYVGIISGNDVPDKVKKSGLNTVKADVVDAPRVEELPVCIECTLESYEDVHCHLVGNIENHLYWGFGKQAGKAFSEGKKLV